MSWFRMMRQIGAANAELYSGKTHFDGWVNAMKVGRNRVFSTIGRLDESAVLATAIAGDWASCGFPTFCLDGKRAAVYACTSAGSGLSKKLGGAL